MTASADCVAAIVGSAFTLELLAPLNPTPESVDTPHGTWTLHRLAALDRPAYVSFRHGFPHARLPHQIPYRAQAAALQSAGCGALLVTSSVGVLAPELPLYTPLVVGDLLTMDNRLPDGSACTMFARPSDRHGHLVLDDGLFSSALTDAVRAHLPPATPDAAVTFGYVGGPRGKTAAENRMWARLGADVNSMTLAPEVILANELEIPCAGLVVGHKYSVPGRANPASDADVQQTLDDSRAALRQAVTDVLQQVDPMPFGNHLFRFD
ncbi:phosphorylase family protein [Salisaeta longa]|uniref:phosphorylase family protein n=1 Tax=Salisaeta longa TaxID=503170 RepID=UPI0003B43C89|nr:5'-methylthioadenosine phosphorylase [Salisaeta longa]